MCGDRRRARAIDHADPASVRRWCETLVSGTSVSALSAWRSELREGAAVLLGVPLRNRVTPLGELVADPARGLVYGNRGCLHDAAGRIRRPRRRRWIACRLEFRGWLRRPLLQPGKFTELFFLDEVTAMAAGHRACALCRREDYTRLGAIWRDLHPGAGRRRCDRRPAHGERRRADGGSRGSTTSSPTSCLTAPSSCASTSRGSCSAASSCDGRRRDTTAGCAGRSGGPRDHAAFADRRPAGGIGRRVPLLHPSAQTAPRPRSSRRVGRELDLVAIGVADVERVADRVVPQLRLDPARRQGRPDAAKPAQSSRIATWRLTPSAATPSPSTGSKSATHASPLQRTTGSPRRPRRRRTGAPCRARPHTRRSSAACRPRRARRGRAPGSGSGSSRPNVATRHAGSKRELRLSARAVSFGPRTNDRPRHHLSRSRGRRPPRGGGRRVARGGLAGGRHRVRSGNDGPQRGRLPRTVGRDDGGDDAAGARAARRALRRRGPRPERAGGRACDRVSDVGRSSAWSR